MARDEKTNDRDAAGTPVDEPAARDEERPIRCAACGARLASGRDVLPVDGRRQHVFTNPAGRVCRFVTVAQTTHVMLVPPATLEHTWFPGFAWQIALCSRCGSHVGWAWTPTAAAATGFFGLLLERVVGPD